MDVFNPYDYGKPVLQPDLFAGRARLLNDIEYALSLATSDRPQYKNFAITGPRGIGKTSLLNKVAAMAEGRGLLASRVELNNELAGNQAALFHQLLEDIVGRLREKQALGKARHWTSRLLGRTSVELEVNFLIGTLKAAQRDSTQVPQESLRRSLGELSKQARASGLAGIVICFDEADLLAKDETTLQALRNTFQQQEGYMLVLCGTEGLIENLGKVFGAMKRFFDQIHLGPLDGPDEVRACLQAPLPEEERPIITSAFAAGVHALTGGAPYFVKLAAYHAYRAFRENGGSDLQLTAGVERAVLDGIQKASPDSTLVENSLARLHELRDGSGVEERAEEDSEEEDFAVDIQSTESVDEAPVVTLVNSFLVEAIARRASALYIVPEPDQVVIRVRVDGRLQPLATAPSDQLSRITSRLKILGRLDIAERRLPQDGLLVVKFEGQRHEYPIMTSPSLHGESVAIRMSQDQSELQDPAALGLDDADLQRFLAALGRSSGLTLIVGPARSGKATTLYAAMAHLVAADLHVMSAEDKVKSVVRSAVQHEAREKIGVTLDNIVRTLRRHDADVIAARPLTDAGAAEQLLKVALSGRRAMAVFAAEDAPSALFRLISLVNDPVGVANAATLVIAQRLLRRICDDCHGASARRPHQPALRCPTCQGTGFKGQFAVYQTLSIDDEIRSALLSDKGVDTVREIARRAGMRDLREVALERVRAKLTTIEEVDRVLPEGTQTVAT